MTVASAAIRFLFLVCGALWLAGCGSSTSTTLDEQRDPFFLSGKNKVNSLDYTGAVESFEKALEVNPRSASAHYELGWLYEQKIYDYAAAIYHYQRYLNLLKEKKETDEVVQQRITGCKEELAKSPGLVPIPPFEQRNLEKLTVENERLRQQVDYLNRQLAMATNYPMRPVPVPVATNPPVTVVSQRGPSNLVDLTRAVVTNRASEPSRSAMADLAKAKVSGKAAARTHTVRSGETLMVIARKYGVSLAALQAANPRADSRKLRPGQTLNVPAP
jgi:LysM repeat protein